MIIQIRGTSGSGKSTAVRQIMDKIGDTTGLLVAWHPLKVAGRRGPIAYKSPFYPTVVVLGHYESPCGGCDTIGSAREVYETIQELFPTREWRVLSEGLLLSEDTKWSLQMTDLRCLFLNTPLDKCLEQIVQRRREGGNDKPLNPANTTNRVRTIERARTKLIEAGVKCHTVSFDQAVELSCKWLLEK